MADIKVTPEASKIKTVGTVTAKAVDGVSAASGRIKEIVDKAKESGEQSVHSEERSPSEYASDKFIESTKDVAGKATDYVADGAKRGIQKLKNAAVKEVRTAAKHSATVPSPTIKSSSTQSRPTNRSVSQLRVQSRTAASVERARTVRSFGADPSIKTVEKAGGVPIKTAKHSIKTGTGSIKTVNTTAQSAGNAAKASAEAAKQAYKMAKAAAKLAAKAAKAAAKAAVKIAKATARAVSALVSAIASGGWIVIVVILAVILVVALVVAVYMLASSAYGIFFSGDETVEGGMTIRTAIEIIDEDYAARIATIEDSVTYDIEIISGERAAWREVLAVYAVSVTTDPDSPQDVATVDDGRTEILKDIFWQMTEISYYIDPDPSETDAETSSPEEGSDTDSAESDYETEPETEPPTIYLYIIVTSMGADEMADVLGFDEMQSAQLNELLSAEYDFMWDELLSFIN